MSDQPGWLGGVSGDEHMDWWTHCAEVQGLGLETAGNTKKNPVWSDHKVENVAWRRDQECLWTSLIPSDFGTLDGTWPPFVVSWHSQGRVQRQVQSRALG